MASGRRFRVPLRLAAIAVIVAVAGCATAPSGGPPRRATGGGSQVQAYVQPLPPPPPTSTWTAADVVMGFLHASASYAFDPVAAERYLVPSLRKSWKPSTGPVAVLGNSMGISSLPYQAQIAGTTGQQLESVKFTGQRLATLSQTGQYQYTPGQDVQYEFILAKIDGVWRIQALPQGQPGLLLTQSDFEAVYQARNLFFYAVDPWQPAGVLVPDPVYAPLQSSNSALNTNLATRLVNGLLHDKGDWLAGATSSAFPPGLHLVGQVTITGRTAKVDLGGAVRVTGFEIQGMEAQLQATLGDQSYSQPLASHVQLYINNKIQYHSNTANSDLVTALASGPVYVITGPDTVGQLSASPGARAVPVPKAGPAQIGRAQVTAIAASPAHGHEPQIAVATQDGTGCAVQLKAAGEVQYRSYALATKGGVCTSLSWDNSGNLWAAAGKAIWVVQPGRRPAAVDVAALAAIVQSGTQIRDLRMAPDGVRAALLVHTKTGNRLLLAAVRFTGDGRVLSIGQPVSIGAGGADPVAISWSDPYHLAVLAGDAIFEVPLTGGAGLQPGGSPQSLGSAPSGAQTLTTNGAELVAGTEDGQIFVSSLGSPGWIRVTTGSDPVYPG